MANKLLVIGNGFDLAAGAKTSYANYFESEQYEETKEKVVKWVNHCLTGSYRSNSLKTLFPDDPKPFNCWDLLFCMRSMHFDKLNCYSEIRNWCDIERVIHDPLTQNSKRSFSWQFIYATISNVRRDAWGTITYYPEPEEHNIMFKYLLSTGWEGKDTDLKSFYNSLLDELNHFERAFGAYISFATEESGTNDYQFFAKKNAEKLAGARADILIDSFNYSDFYGERLRIPFIT